MSTTNIRPLRDRLVVEPLDPPLSTIIQVVTDTKGKHSRGRVLAVGPSVKFDDIYRPRTAVDTQVGDVVHFTDIFKFPDIFEEGARRIVIQEADICGIEEREAAAA